MTGRIRRSIIDMFSALSARRERRTAPRRDIASGAVRGNMRSVIVVHPAGGIFAEAVFVLRDDYMRTPGVSREALLLQAREAAEEYTRRSVPDNGRGHIPVWAIAAVILAACAAAAYLLLM